MTNKTRFTINLLLAATACLGSSGIVAACGCFNSRSMSMSQDGTNVYATATFNFSYLCQAEVTATITAPNLTTGFSDSGITAYSPVATTANLVYGTHDGTYSGGFRYYYDGYDVGYGSGWLTDLTSTYDVAKFVKIVDTTYSPTSIARVSDHSLFTASILTSDHCGGAIRVANGLSGFTDLTGITNTPAVGNPATPTAFETLTVGNASSADFKFTVATTAANSAYGILHLTAYLDSYPTGCTVQAPDAGHFATRDLTINN